MKGDYLYGTPFRIEQKKEMYHFNSDTEFLGRMLKIKKGESVFDIGTNNGALLLFASLYTNDLSGIDLFPEVISLAEKNLKENGFSPRLYVGKVQNHCSGPYDVVICNPPYFDTRVEHLKNENLYRRAARHQEYLSPEELFQSAFRLMKEEGTLQIVHRACREEELCACAAACGLYPLERRVAYDTQGGVPKSIVLFFGKQKKEVRTDRPAYMDERDSFERSHA